MSPKLRSLPPSRCHSSGLLQLQEEIRRGEKRRGKSDTLGGLGVCQSVKCERVETPQQSTHIPSPWKHPLDKETGYSHTLTARLSTRTLDEFVTKSSQKKKKIERGKKASRFRVSAVIIPWFLFIVIIYFKSARRSVPGYFSAVKCAHIGDAWCVPTAPTDRQTHPAAFPASPLLHPSTSVTLTVRAHLSICGC